MGEGRNALNILTGKSTASRPVWRLKGRWEDSIRANFVEIGDNV